MNWLKPFFAWYRRSQFDEECRGVGRQAIDLAMQHAYSDIALVRFQLVGKDLVPTVHALTPRQNEDIRVYLTGYP
jgi:hypothetical protein